MWAFSPLRIKLKLVKVVMIPYQKAKIALISSQGKNTFVLSSHASNEAENYLVS